MMLEEVHIRHYALIDELRVPLGPGLNLLTGETGAGKSIIVDALTLLLGARASGDDVRAGEERAVVTARFRLGDAPAAVARLGEMGVDAGGELVMTREVQAGGGSRAYLNGRPATLAMLRAVGEELVEVHGQHEGLRLLRPAAHLDLLDAFGGAALAVLRAGVEALARERGRLRAEARELREGERERARHAELLAHQVREIDEAGLRPGEAAALTARRRVLASAARLREGAERAYRAIREGERGGALAAAREAAAALQDLAGVDPSLAAAARQLQEASVLLEETGRDLRRYLDGLEGDADSLEAIDDRLQLLRMLVRKYGAGPPGGEVDEDAVEALRRARDDAASELERLGGAERRLGETAAALGDVERRLAEGASRLSAARAAAAVRLRRGVQAELRALGMGETAFLVELARTPDPDGIAVGGERVALTPRGIDQVQFLIAPNPGEAPRPLHRIASGGELSRLMLALRAALIDEGEGALTLIFDEVDAGIGARTAAAVGARLARLSARHQVICITHLAPIASLADVHLQVYKDVVLGRTRTGVRLLDARARLDEVARMLGAETGRDGRAREAAREHAAELLRAAGRAGTVAPAGRSPRAARGPRTRPKEAS